MIEVVGILETSLAMTPLTAFVLRKAKEKDAYQSYIQLTTLLTRPIDAVIQILSIPILSIVQECQICQAAIKKNGIFHHFTVLRIGASLSLVIFKTVINSILVGTSIIFAMVKEPAAVIIGFAAPSARIFLFRTLRKGYARFENSYLDFAATLANRVSPAVGQEDNIRFYLPFQKCLFIKK
jgi:hypothetical protein